MSKRFLRSQTQTNKINSKEGILVKLPLQSCFQPSKLPLLKEVVGLVFHLYSTKFSGKGSYDDVCIYVTKILIEHWHTHNIHTIVEKNEWDRLKGYMAEYRVLS